VDLLLLLLLLVMLLLLLLVLVLRLPVVPLPCSIRSICFSPFPTYEVANWAGRLREIRTP
jgi:hypothetical protein